MKNKKTLLSSIIILAMSFAFCSNDVLAQDKHKMQVTKAVCVLYPTVGNKVSGAITFTTTEKGVKVAVAIHGLTQGKHGFHIHECGDCSAADASSAGGHFNPMGAMHGTAMDMSSHMGDMGNLIVDANGDATIEYIDPMLSLSGDNSIIGRSIIIHKDEDDLKTQPTGNSGARIACGVIGIGK
jgi:Cu-Zn family superoxide dismutase